MKMYEGLKGCGKRFCKLILEVTDEIIIFFDVRGSIIGSNVAANAFEEDL